MSRKNAVYCLVTLIACTLRLQAMTIIPPVNLAELARDSDVVVLANARDSWAVGEGFFATRTEFLVEETLAGDAPAGQTIEVEAPGGRRGDQVCVVPGSPSFETGRTYFLCLSRRADGVLTPRLGGYGVLREAPDLDGKPALAPLPRLHFSALSRPDGLEAEPVTSYRKAELVDHLRSCIDDGADWDARRIVAQAALLHEAIPGGCVYFLISAGGVDYRFRWFEFDAGGSIAMAADQTNDSQVDALSIVPAALNVWNSPSIPNASIRVNYAGTVPRALNCPGGVATMQNTIVFNDPCGVIPDLGPTGGILAQGGVLAGLSGSVTATRYAIDSCNLWARIEGWYVLVNNNIIGPTGISNLTQYQLALSHELGHGLGFDHVPDPNAMMNGTCCHGINATDITCAQYSYARLAAGISTSSASLDFGTVNIGAQKSLFLNIRSVGTADLHVTGFQRGAGTSTEYGLVAPGNVLVSPCVPDPSFNIQVTYSPANAGVDNGTLVITSDDPDSSPLSVQLGGEGVVPPAADIDVSPTSVSFGDVLAGSQATRTITIRNAGTAALSVTSVGVAAGAPQFSMTGATTANLVPGGSINVDVRFAPAAAGARTGRLDVRSADPDEAVVSVGLSGNGIQPRIEVAPPQVAFGDVTVGTSRRLGIAIRNTGTAELNVTRIALEPGTSGDLSYIGPASKVLGAGTTQQIEIGFAPGAVGPDAGALLVDSNDPTTPAVRVPLSGTGTRPAGGGQIPGDCNQDGVVDISDPICLLGFLFLGTPSVLPCGSAGAPEPDGPAGEADVALLDWNGDGSLDLSDTVATLNWAFNGGFGSGPHVLDPTGSATTCVRILGCPDTCAP